MLFRSIGPLKIEVWSNPDVGVGSFFVVIDPPPGSSVPSDIKVQVAVQPVSRRLPEAIYGAWREKLKDRVEFKTVARSTRKRCGTCGSSWRAPR